ncbi:hypothetical protein vseg_005942 [Gypsophila vaccaria]
METPTTENGTPLQFGDRTTSDVVVRLRTPEGRDEWLYCHTSILIKKISDSLISESEHGVRNALGILRVALELDCPNIVSACVQYLESVPWEESEEEEILRTIPNMGPSVNPILSRLQPVDPATIFRIFLSALRLAMSSPPPSLKDLKTSAQEQLEYMLTDDDDAPLLTACDKVKLEVRECTKTLLSNFSSLLESLMEDKTTISKTVKFELLKSHLSDLSWACQISSKLDIMRDLVTFWSDVSSTLVRILEDESSITETVEIKFKTIEVSTKIIEAIGYGHVILPTAKRLHMVNIWLPFARATKPIIDASSNDIEDDDDNAKQRTDSDIWQTLESAFISIILALPSDYQADILSEWLGNQHIQYPDLTEAFEVWCYRSKVAKKRLASCVSPFE